MCPFVRERVPEAKPGVGRRKWLAGSEALTSEGGAGRGGSGGRGRGGERTGDFDRPTWTGSPRDGKSGRLRGESRTGGGPGDADGLGRPGRRAAHACGWRGRLRGRLPGTAGGRAGSLACRRLPTHCPPAAAPSAGCWPRHARCVAVVTLHRRGAVSGSWLSRRDSGGLFSGHGKESLRPLRKVAVGDPCRGTASAQRDRVGGETGSHLLRGP